MFAEKEQALETLRAILLEDDRKLSLSIESELDRLKDELLVPENFGNKVEPFAQAKIDHLKKNFGIEFKGELKDAIQRELKDSQDEVINSLYPIIGKLIKKYLQAELEKLTESIDNQISTTFDLDIWIHRVKAFFSGADSSSIILSELNKASIEEIFVIQNDSGLLLGSYSKNNISDQDMIAGMLTAIKSFVEDAFHKQNQTLSTIEYENNKILLLDYYTFKMAFVVSGIAGADFKSKLQEKADAFVTNYLKEGIKNVTSEVQKQISLNLENHFINHD